MTADSETQIAAGANEPTERPLQVFLGYRVRRAWLAIQADLAEALQPFELRMITYTALALVKGNPGLSQAQLAGLMNMERPNLVSIVDELEKRGLVTRDPSPEDRRAYALNLTRSGLELHSQATEAVTAHETRMSEGLTASDRKAVETALDQIRKNAERGSYRKTRA